VHDVVVKKFTFPVSSRDELLVLLILHGFLLYFKHFVINIIIAVYYAN